MNRMQIKTRAKINFSIDVIGKRKNGYHDVEMIMQTVELYDDLRIEKISSGIEILCDKDNIPTDSRNIAYKAAEKFLDIYGIEEGVRIHINKRIPVCAGLAGGSTNAAGVLILLNKMFGIGASKHRLCEIGVTLGADVPFCIIGGTNIARGLGEILTPIENKIKFPIVLVKPAIGVSTKWVYENFDFDNKGEEPNTNLLREYLLNGDLYGLSKNMRNVLESVTAKEHSVIFDIKNRLVSEGALGSIMSGSGSAVFGIFNDEAQAKNAISNMKNTEWECYYTVTHNEVD